MAKFNVNKLAAACTAALYDTMTHAADLAVIVTEEKGTISNSLRDALLDMRAAALTSGAYLTVCVVVFGNGERHTSKTYTPGTLRTRLVDNGVNLDSIKWWTGLTRGVAQYLADPAAKTHDAKGELLPLRTMYEAYKTSKKPLVVPHKEVTDEDGETIADKAAPIVPLPNVETASQWAALGFAKFGMSTALREIAAILATARTTAIQAKTIAAIADQMTATKAA